MDQGSLGIDVTGKTASNSTDAAPLQQIATRWGDHAKTFL